MKKRVLAMLLCLAMFCSMVSAPALAAGTFTLEGGKISHPLKVGDTISFPINITKNPGLAVGKVTVKYDTAVLKLKTVNYKINK